MPPEVRGDARDDTVPELTPRATTERCGCGTSNRAPRFRHDAGAPLPINPAERDLPTMKLRMQISGAFRSERGAMDFTPLRSLLPTASKQGRHRTTTLMRGPAVLLLKGQRC